ncbi:hypothetical protein BGW36DRAFT_425735 [Talaromyces proteolyticus]|uniref:Zn(2)-C6 fungal-type domain-containing protein n=1 Tax=Talaromyces proteolyticus TaxID=1131652 RepID=A0AAD4KZX8_9EURO|nr:uncharacterized protein BGW36DRAFT_425735 [Talaromyces proteolyticus]KAH8700935.1 hypothetical protein BGW36DRAFT_425735 [Talaromyces proteolyticus]
MSSIENNTRSRVAKARRTCRLRKVRCSGTVPCRSCTARNQQCIFEETDRKVVISERHLRDLQRRASASNAHNQEQTTHLPRTSDSYSPAHLADDEEIPEGIDNVDNHPSTLSQNEPPTSPIIPTGPWRGMNAISRASTWAFVRKALSIQGLQYQRRHIRLPPRASYGIALCTDPALWNASDIACLPRSEYIAHLARTADFHLNTSLFLFDVSIFLKNLRDDTTPDRTEPHAGSNVWFAQVFIVIALGKLFLVNRASSLGPPGTNEFVQSMKLLPLSPTLTDQGSQVMFIETLCLLSVYAQAADLHGTAYIYGGFYTLFHLICANMGVDWPSF